jgi:hypothetical protein
MRFALLALTLMLASPALAGGLGSGINFAWNQCLPEGGTERATFDCSTNGGSQVAVGSFMLNGPLEEFVGLEVDIDVLANGPTLPDWWQYFNPGSCRQTALSASFNFLSFPRTQCVDPWNGLAAGGLAAYQTSSTIPPMPNPVPNGARIRIGAAVANPVTLPGGVEMYAFQLVLSHARTTGSNACAGCGADVCLRLREIVPTSRDGTRWILNEGLESNTIGWQCGRPMTYSHSPLFECRLSTDCATATEATTWGQIKSLYR